MKKNAEPRLWLLLERLRGKENMTVLEWSTKLGYSSSAYHRMRRKRALRPDTVRRVAAALGVMPKALRAWAEEGALIPGLETLCAEVSRG